jgi:predicted dehydrogenase
MGPLLNKLRVGVVGTGYLGTFHAQKYSAMTDVDLVAVVDTDFDKARSLAKKLSVQAFPRPEDIHDRVDAVSIAVPTSFHHHVARGFLQRGVDVLIEKPITENLTDATELIRIAERKRCLLQVGHLERFNTVWKAAGPALQKPMFIEAHRLGPFQDRGTDVDVVLDLMIHDIDIVLKYVRSPVQEVYAAGVPVLSSNLDIANVRLHFENGAVANLTASRVSLKKTRKIRFFQQDLYVSVDYDKGKTQIIKRTPCGKSRSPQITGEEQVAPQNDSLNEELTAFVHCVKTRTPPEVDGRQGRQALRVAMRILRRMRPASLGLRNRS